MAVKKYKIHKDETGFPCMRDVKSDKLNYDDHEFVILKDYEYLQKGIRLVVEDRDSFIEECQLLKDIRDANIELSWGPSDKEHNQKLEKAELAYYNWKQKKGL